MRLFFLFKARAKPPYIFYRLGRVSLLIIGPTLHGTFEFNLITTITDIQKHSVIIVVSFIEFVEISFGIKATHIDFIFLVR